MHKQREAKTIDLLNSLNSYVLQICKDTLLLSTELKDKEESSPFKPPFAINYLEYYNTQEPTTSWIIRHIFAYTYNGKHPYWESFATTFLQQIGFQVEWIESPIIDKDHEYKNIDILVRDKKYAVIIENKLKGAEFQLNQLARYIATMRKDGYTDEQIFVVVLPKCEKDSKCINESVWRLPNDWQSTNQTRKCRVDSYTCLCDKENFIPQDYCIKCESLRDSFAPRTIFVQKELSDWLYNFIEYNTEHIPEDEMRNQYVLKSAVYQFVDFLNYLYETRENKKYKMDIHNFLEEKLGLNKLNILEQLSVVEDRKDDAEELSSKLDELYWKKINEYIAEIGTKHKVHLKKTDDFHFSCDILLGGKTLKVSLGFEKNGGDYCQIEAKKGTTISEIINDDFEILEELNDKENFKYCIWRWDSYKESLLRFDRVLGRLLEIQKAKNG
ncbi:MAG: PD-(D/E)XK nuclease family protein [Paludibacteraceae bacterium]|nr:PD-(D/E)XK nuclease family protein [Paludibacteraceae bacterium]